MLFSDFMYNDLFSLKTDVNMPTERNKQKNLKEFIFVGMQNADQNVEDPEHYIPYKPYNMPT